MKKVIYSSPLSYAQQRLWFLDKLVPNSAMYNIPLAFHLRGSLNIEAVEYSIQQITKRHETLKSAIITDSDGGASQYTYNDLDIKLNKISLDKYTQKQIDEFLTKESQTPFYLDSPPLFRVTLYNIGSNDNILLFVFHHIIFDGWSGNIFFSEFELFYNSFVKDDFDKLSSLRELEIQYSDFANWQREYFRSDIIKRQIAYWKKAFQDCQNTINLPYDFSRPVISSYAGRHVYTEIKDRQNFYKLIKEFAASYKFTVYTILLSAFYILLYKYSNQSNINIGINLHNRHYEGIENVIGFFVNTLPMRIKLDDQNTVIEILDKVKEALINTHQNQDVPFEKIVDSLNVERKINFNPIFQVLMEYKSAGKQTFDLKGVDAQELTVNFYLTKFDLCFFISSYADDFNIVTQYSKDLFSDKTVSRMLENYKKILELIVFNNGSEKKMKDIKMVMEEI